MGQGNLEKAHDRKEIKEHHEFPPGWRWVKLGDVCEIIMGQSPPGNTYTGKPDGLPFFQGKVDFREYSPKVRVWCTQPKKIAEEGDILISVRAPVGPVNMSNLKCCIGRGLAGIRCKDEIAINWYIFWYLQFIENQIASLGSGSTFGAITRSDLANLGIPLPPIKEQRRIAAKIQELMQEVERARNACEKQLEAAKAIPSAYLGEVFESEEAKKWDRKRLGDDRFFTILPSGIDYFEGTKEYLSTNSIQKDKVTHIEAVITYGERPSRANMQPRLNSVWFAKMKDTVKVYSFTKKREEEIGRFILSTGFAEILCKDGVCPEYLKHIFLYFAEFNKTKDELASGATQQAVNNEGIKSIPVPLPPLSVQQRIASELKEKMAQVENLQSAIQNQQSALNALPQSILRKAFRGELKGNKNEN